MNIIIHGTKGGYRVFYSSPNSPAIAGDSRSAASSENPVGKSAFAIAFASNGCLLTKYVIVRDLMRSMSTGNVAFSIYLPNDKKLSGADVKSLLDKLSNHYCTKYAPENNLDNVYEDWSFVEEIASSFTIENISADNTEKIQQGTVDAAFVYYSSDEELQKYFNKPYQEEYSDYKQIFFVRNDLKNKPENPLNALHHSENDLTGKIDLENLKYKLLFNSNTKDGIKIDVKVNGSSRLINSKIRQKNDLEITWSKPYYKTVIQRGKYSEISPEYIDFDNNAQSISIKAIELKAEEKAITLEIKDRKGDLVIDPDIQIGIQNGQKISQPSTIVSFKGEDIGKRWNVIVKKDHSLFSDSIHLFPENQIGPLIINLRERKIIEIIATNDEGIVSDFTIRIKGKANNNKTTKVEFIDDEIDKTWDIEISRNERSGFYSGEVQFCPKNVDRLYVQLQKNMYSSPKPYYFSIDAGEHGSLKHGLEYSSNRPDGSDVIDKIVPVKGYKFTYFELRDNILIAQYKKKKTYFSSSKVIASIIVTTLCLIVFTWFVISYTKSGNDQQTITKLEIKNYTEGDILLPNKLKVYNEFWEAQKSKAFENREETENWNEISRGINLAIKKRDLIESKNFEQLQKQPYSPIQKGFQRAVALIKSDDYKIVGNKLDNVSDLTLNQITDKINSILIDIERQSKDQSDETINKEAITEVSGSDEMQQGNSNGSSPALSVQKPSKNSGGTRRDSISKSNQNSKLKKDVIIELSKEKIKEITDYLRGEKIDRQKLDEYKKLNGIPNPLKASLQLCLDFWELDGTSGKSYYSFYNKVKGESNLKNSDLKTFVEKQKIKESTKYFKGLPKSDQNQIKTLVQLSEIIQ